jgi:hypothetical protein
MTTDKNKIIKEKRKMKKRGEEGGISIPFLESSLRFYDRRLFLLQ